MLARTVGGGCLLFLLIDAPLRRACVGNGDILCRVLQKGLSLLQERGIHPSSQRDTGLTLGESPVSMPTVLCKMSADLKSEGSGSAVYCLQDELIEEGDEDDYRYEEVLLQKRLN